MDADITTQTFDMEMMNEQIKLLNERMNDLEKHLAENLMQCEFCNGRFAEFRTTRLMLICTVCKKNCAKCEIRCEQCGSKRRDPQNDICRKCRYRYDSVVE